MRQAIVIIHGIGEQRPMATLREFVVGALNVGTKKALDEFVFSKPDRIDTTLELRRLSATTIKWGARSPLKSDCETDFYELYWQHLMPVTTWSSVLAWAFPLAFSPNSTERLRSARLWILGLLVAAIVGIAGLGIGLYLYLEGSPLWQSVAILSAPVVGVLGWLAAGSLKWFVRDRAERFFLGYVGDAARYLTPAPANIKARHDIRTAGLALLRGLHEDELRRYDRIVLVGHSLGSVIGYDLITWFWQERHHRQEAERCDGKREAAAMHPATPKQGDDDSSPLKKLANPCSEEFPTSQWSLLQEMQGPDPREQGKWAKGHRLPWRITDFVTLGSPLAHAEVLLASSKKAFEEGIKQREFPVCPPPKCEDPRDRGHLGRTFEYKDGPHYVHILHHGAPFAVTRWTNLFFTGDIIGGRVAPLFGHGVRDVELCAPPRGWLDRLIPPRSHTRYWDPTAGYASEKLCSALRLNDPSGQSDCVPKKPDASA